MENFVAGLRAIAGTPPTPIARVLRANVLVKARLFITNSLIFPAKAQRRKGKPEFPVWCLHALLCVLSFARRPYALLCVLSFARRPYALLCVFAPLRETSDS